MTTYLKDIDTNSIQRAQSAKHYAKTASAATHESMIGEVSPILTNPMNRLDTLVNLSSSAEYFAANGILASIGWNVVNALMWQYRRRNQAANIPAPSIDINEGLINTRQRNTQAEDNGFEVTERFDYTDKMVVGVYRQMYFNQAGCTLKIAAMYPPTAPHAILHGMQTTDSSKELSEAELEFKAKQVSASPARLELEAAAKATRKVFDQHQIKMHKLEEAFVLSEIKGTIPQELTDENWAQFPITVQYKWVMSIFKQVVKAYAYEDALEEDKKDAHNMQQLLELAGEIRLELEAANRHKEIKQAFANGALTEKHELMISPEVVIEKAKAPKAKPARVKVKPTSVDKLDTLINKFNKK